MMLPSGKKAKKYVVLAIGVLVVAIWAAFTIWDRNAASQTPAMMTALVATGDVRETVLASGILKPRRLVAVGAQVSGRVTSLKVALGQQVKKGDLIAQIDSLPQQNALRTAQATLANNQAQRVEKEATLAFAVSSLARQQLTLAQKATSHADFDSAEAAVKTTKAQIEALDAQIVAAEVAVETARVNLGYTQITAPIDGTVLATVAQEGQTVNAVQSAPTIVILGQLDVMTVRAEISEADVVKVAPGQTVYFTILGNSDQRYNATLESIEPAPESITSDSSFSSSSASSSSSSASSTSAVYYNGIFHVPNPDGRLKTYMTAEVHIIIGEAKDVLKIPSAALGSRKRSGAYPVMVVDRSGGTSPREIEVGLNDKTTAEVRSGLKEGERVVMEQLSADNPAARPGTRRSPMGF